MTRIAVTAIIPSDGSTPYFVEKAGASPLEILTNYPIQDGRMLGFLGIRNKASVVIQDAPGSNKWVILHNLFEDTRKIKQFSRHAQTHRKTT